MPIFAPDRDFVWSGVRAFRDRRVPTETRFALVGGPVPVCRGTGVTRRGALVVPVDRFGVRVVAFRVAAPEPASVAPAGLLRERSELVLVLAFVRRRLLLERAWALATLLWSPPVDAGPFGPPALRSPDATSMFLEVLDLARVGLPPTFSAFGAVLSSLDFLAAGLWERSVAPALRLSAAPEGLGALEGFFDARRLAGVFLRVDAGARSERSLLVAVCCSFGASVGSGRVGLLRAWVEWRRAAARSPALAGTSVISTSPSSDTGRSGIRLPSSSGSSSLSGAA